MTASALRADTPERGSHKAHIREASQILILDAAESVFARNGFGGATMAAIAEAAGVPKANLHYYFRTKEQLYRAVLDRTLDLWLAETDPIVEDADPGEALAAYIRAKMRLSQERPDASRVFANEVLHGAQHIEGYLTGRLRRLVADKTRVIDGWVARGLMDAVDTRHLFFTLWAATQTYADFDVQVRAVLGVKRVSATEHERATQQLVRIVLQGLGVRTL
ncbi:MAG: TetR/AcrR family transcriptional regulator [Aquabacterium sp.]|jgi:TetR/AcrR family transcriptional regulator|nr:MAG: TetR/AcrR family transcriptional regulator [Aquabacterium sp.]